MTNNELLSVGRIGISGIPSVPFICPVAPGEGLAVGAGIFISTCGEADGWVPGEGEAAGASIAGLASAEGDGEGVGDGTGFGDGLSLPGGWPVCCPRTASPFAKTRAAANAAT